MATRRDIEAGRAYVELYIKNSKFLRGVENINKHIRKIGGGFQRMGAVITAAGLAIVGSITLAARKFASFGDDLHKMAAKTGVGVTALSELKFAAEQSGASIDTLGNVLQKMNRRFGRVTAGQGTAGQIKALEELGVSVEHLKGLDAEGRFLAIADAMSKYGDRAAAAGLAQRVFGAGVDKLLPLIWEGKEGIQKLREEARELGLSLSGEDAAAAAAYTDATNRLKRTLEAAWMKIGAAVAPVLTDIANRFAKGLKPLIEWIDQNRAMLVLALQVGAGLTAFGVALVTVGTLLTGVSIAISASITALGLMAGAVTTAIGLLGSPIFLTAAAGIAAIAVAAHQLYKGGHLAGWIEAVSGALGDIVEDFKTAWQGISDAIKAGDLELAWDIVVASLNVAWAGFVDGLAEEFEPFRKWWQEVTFAMASVFIDQIADMRTCWANFNADITDEWRASQRLMGEIMANMFERLTGSRAGHKLLKGYDFGVASLPELDRSKGSAIQEERRAAQKALEEDYARGLQRDKGGKSAAERELEAARQRLNDLVEEAGRRTKDRERGKPPGEPEVPGLPEFGARRAGEVYGTFSSAAALAMSGGRGGGPQERTARASEETNKRLLELIDKEEEEIDLMKKLMSFA